MKIYYLKWFDKEYDEITTIIINESQKKLIDFMIEHFLIHDMLLEHNIVITITENENQSYNLAVD